MVDLSFLPISCGGGRCNCARIYCMFSTTGFEQISPFLWASYMSSDKYFLVSDWRYQIKKECQVCYSVHTLSVQFWKPKSRESASLSQVAQGDNGTPQNGKNPWFSHSYLAFLQTKWVTAESLNQGPVICYVPFTGPERSVWILSTPTRWRPNAEPTVGLRQGSAPTGTKGAK